MGGRISLGDHATVAAVTVIKCDGEVSIGAYTQVSSFTLVYGSAAFVMGDHSYLGPQSLINADEDVRLGRQTALGARAVVYTHGSWLPYTEGYWVRFGRVTVGDYVWCAAGVFLHPGVTIGSRVFVNSRSVVTSDLPDDCVAEGAPARQVARMGQLRRAMTPTRVDSVIREMMLHFAEVELNRSRGLKPVQETRHTWRIEDRNRTWRMTNVGCDTTGATDPSPAHNHIYLINRPGLAERLGPISPTLDFTTMRANTRGDAICEALVEFLRRYYGVQFEFANIPE
jgi:acetyltransferase-like isoleucine patch superfamily enzyme